MIRKWGGPCACLRIYWKSLFPLHFHLASEVRSRTKHLGYSSQRITRAQPDGKRDTVPIQKFLTHQAGGMLIHSGLLCIKLHP